MNAKKFLVLVFIIFLLIFPAVVRADECEGKEPGPLVIVTRLLADAAEYVVVDAT